MKEIPTELANKLKACRANITCLTFRKWGKDRVLSLKNELDDLHEQLVCLLDPEDEEFPPDLYEKMNKYSDKIESYLERFSSMKTRSREDVTINRDENDSSQENDMIDGNENDGSEYASVNGDINDVSNEMANLSLSYKPKIRLEQLPTFDGKFVNWKPYKSMMLNLLVNNTSIDEVMKKSLLLKTLSNEPARIVGILIGELKSLSVIWKKLCDKYDDHELAILEIKNELRKIPRIANENQTENLKMAKDIVENANLAVKFLETDSSFYVTNLIQAVAYKFYYRAQRKMLSDMANFEDVVKYIDKLYKSALKYDYNKIEKSDQPTRFKEETKRSSVAAFSSRYCFICGSNHQDIYECFDKFDSNTIADVIKGKGLCVICLRRGHLSRNCPSLIDNSCEKCKRFHATEMHDVLNVLYQTKPKETADSIPSSSSSSLSSSLLSEFSINESLISESSINESSINESSDSGSVAAISHRNLSNVFDIEKVGHLENRPMIYGNCNGVVSVMLLDSGSDISLIDQDLLLDDTNNSDKKYSMVTTSPLGVAKTTHKKVVLKVRSNSKEISIVLFSIKMNEKNLIIIGTDNLGFFYKNQPKVLSIPTIFGDISYQARKNLAACSSIEMNNPISAREDVIDIFELKNDQSSLKPVEELLKLEAENELNIVNDEDEDDDIMVKRLITGRFEARLPFLSEQRPKDNFNKALFVLEKLLKRLDYKNKRDEYEKQLLTYVDNNHAEEVFEASGYFLPHHPVFRDSASTPIRVVFNGSFGYEALNKLLWKGNAHGLDVFDHLMRFRKGQFAFTADLSKAFLQVMIHPDDRKFLKFLWKNKNNEIKIYQMKVLPFGLVSSPAILTNVTKRLLSDQNLEEIANAIYMDDIIWSSNSESDLMKMIGNVRDCFNNAGFTMHKICSNSDLVLNNIDCEEHGSKKVLGVIWNTQNDSISNVIPDIQPINTRRELLSMIGKFFDPYGFLDPWKLKLRSLYREILLKDWDEPLPDQIINDAMTHLQCIDDLKELKMNRNIDMNGDLHGFADASLSAYGYAIYIKKDDEMHFLFGKAKLSPCKIKTIVELELLALYELGKILSRMHVVFHNRITIWSDSMINLQRFGSSPNNQKRNVASQLMKILKIVNDLNITIRHVNGLRNPADLFSRINDSKSYLKNFKFIINSNFFDFSDSNRFETYRVSSISIKNFEFADHVDEFRKLESIDQMMNFVEKLLPIGNTAIDRWNLIYRFSQFGSNTNQIDLPLMYDDIVKIKTRNPNFSPIWIPKESNVVLALIQFYHLETLHGGIKTTMAEIQSRFYIQNLYRLVKNSFIIVMCAKLKRRNRSFSHWLICLLPELYSPHLSNVYASTFLVIFHIVTERNFIF
ncbi:LOW QUALITY PROTEIN: uncharacterized protein LOC113790880 [Dermatophagoides pteronyssinus]|uniref:LOW QUALITY PROTEIN: uncharacterized protein LOC113790880 n=1 Tax=Dermatophagoides pteronyssinus TaxID=6956 RepID=UPI003F6805B4